MYADACKTQDKVLILENQYIQFKLPNLCSIYTAKATAILETIKIDIKNKHSKFLIFSDSLSSLNSIKNIFKPGHIAIKIKNKLNEASSINNQIILMWISGHNGIKGNEIADQQTKNPTNNIDSTIMQELIYDDIKTHIKEITNNKWLNLQNQQNTN